MYVDHFLSGAESEKESIKRSDDLEIVFKWDGFKLTTVTFSQKYSLETLTDDGGEHKRSWDPVVSQGSQECSKYWWAQFYKNDSKKKAYAKLQNLREITQMDCVSKATEIFDIPCTFMSINV